MDPERSSEAEAQSEETLMPWLWGLVGLVIIGIYVAWVLGAAPRHQTRNPPAAAPLSKPIGQRL